METAGKGWEREGSSVPGGHLFTIISERSERAIDHSEVNQGMRENGNDNKDLMI